MVGSRVSDSRSRTAATRGLSSGRVGIRPVAAMQRRLMSRSFIPAVTPDRSDAQEDRIRLDAHGRQAPGKIGTDRPACCCASPIEPSRIDQQQCAGAHQPVAARFAIDPRTPPDQRYSVTKDLRP
jgi:hypothetical protein